MALTITLRDLVTAISESAQSENEVVATVVHMINSGQVRLHGTYTGAQVDVPSRRSAATA